MKAKKEEGRRHCEYGVCGGADSLSQKERMTLLKCSVVSGKDTPYEFCYLEGGRSQWQRLRNRGEFAAEVGGKGESRLQERRPASW